jgi:type IV pilus assembly protein PilN
MRVPINLASQPLENLRPLRTAVALATVAVVALAGVIVQRQVRSRNEFRSLIQQQANLELSLKNHQTEQEALESWLSTDQARRIQERSAFLNSLILRKSLSWTQLFEDLEKTLPGPARIVSIRPSLSDSHDVNLSLTVSATSMTALVDFLKNLESSQQFGGPVVESQRFPGEKSADKGILLDITTQYRQERLAVPAPAAANAAPGDSGELAAKKEETQ